MLAKVMSGAVYGVDAYPVEIEVNAGGGEDMKVIVVGLPDIAVKESKDRVITALFNSGYFPPRGRTTVNLAPADIKKEGPSFDLPIALGMISASTGLDEDRLEGLCAVGELALSGEIRKVKGILPITLQAKEQGLRGIIVPEENAEEAGVVTGIDVYPMKTLREAALYLQGKKEASPLKINMTDYFKVDENHELDFLDVKGQESARRAIEVAVAGGHNVLFIGPPGTGKSMLAKRVPSILPPMSMEEALETTKIHSIAGKLPTHEALVRHRPFEAPHHTVSDAGLLGGGTYPVPGEVSLAHNGVLFLDELPEFRRNVLEVLRQPLEDGEVTISRAAASVTFPSNFMLVAAMNPCPCGYQTDPRRECRCTPTQIERYRSKISGPLLDRIDIHIEVPAVGYEELASMENGESSSVIRNRVLHARNMQQTRFTGINSVHCNAAMRSRELKQHVQLDDEAQQMLKSAMQQMNLSARAYDRILKVARTIADLEGKGGIDSSCIYEAIQYRSLDRQLW